MYQTTAATLPPWGVLTLPLEGYRMKNRKSLGLKTSLHHWTNWNHMHAEFLTDVKLLYGFSHFQFHLHDILDKEKQLETNALYKSERNMSGARGDSADVRLSVSWDAQPSKEFRNWTRSSYLLSKHLLCSVHCAGCWGYRTGRVGKVIKVKEITFWETHDKQVNK